MGYAERYVQELEGKRKDALAAVGAYVALLRDGRKLLDPKTDLREKIDVILPPISKFEQVVRIARV